MLVKRVINEIEIEIDPNTGGDIYVSENFSRKLPSSGINDILFTLYEEKKEYIPAALMMELTNGCNFNCPFCYIHSCKDKVYMKSGTQWIEQLRYLIANGLLSVTITGGECLLHPDFIMIYKYLKKEGVLVTVLTNLSLLTDEIYETFLEYPPYKIDVTIYGIDNKKMQLATAQKKYNSSLVLDNILKLKNAGLNVTCKTPGNTLTDEQLQEIETWCKLNQVTYFSSLEIFENYQGLSMEQYALSQERIVSDHVNTRKNKYQKTIHEFGYKINFDCKGGQYGLFISYNDFLRPCMPFYDVEEANFNISELGLEVALLKMKRFIYKYQGKRLEYCEGCSVFKLCQECIITQLREHKGDLHEHMNAICEKNKEIYSV